MSEVHRHSATGHNGPDGSVCFMEGHTTPGKLLVKEINFVRQTAPAGQFRSVNAGFLPLILQADQKYRVSAITARLMLQIMSGRLTGH